MNDKEKIFEAKVDVTRRRLSASAARSLIDIETYDILLFTSKHAVAFFMAELDERKIALPKKKYIGAVGPVTAKAAHAFDLSVHVIPEVPTADDLIEKLGDVKGKRILFPRSAIASRELINKLHSRGAFTTVLPLYTATGTLLSIKEKNELLAGAFDWLVFKSPSGMRGLLKQFTHYERYTLQEIPVVCIGPTTEAAAIKAGFKKVKRRDVV
jgi:uroporphyrinogen-III synthase